MRTISFSIQLTTTALAIVGFAANVIAQPAPNVDPSPTVPSVPRAELPTIKVVPPATIPSITPVAPAPAPRVPSEPAIRPALPPTPSSDPSGHGDDGDPALPPTTPSGLPEAEEPRTPMLPSPRKNGHPSTLRPGAATPRTEAAPDHSERTQSTRGNVYRRATGGAVLAATPGYDVSAVPLARAKLAADIDRNPHGAASEYAAIVAKFDAQRATAAEAIFGLGESYRRLKRFEEARVQYARILREFVDFPQLTRQSQQQLAGIANMEGSYEASHTTAHAFPNLSLNEASYPRDRESLQEAKGLILEELKLLEQELAATKTRVQMGLESTSASLPLQRDILRLKQQLLRFPKEERAPDAGNQPPTSAPF